MSATVRRTLGRPLVAVTVLMAIVLGTAVMGVFSGPRPATAQQTGPGLSGDALVAALQRGGYVILFRHGITDKAQSDVQPLDFTNCEAQRNLDDNGRAQAQVIGEAFQVLSIPVGQVVSSRYCRALDTAALIAGPAQPSDDLLEIVTPVDNNGRPRQPTPEAIAQQRTAVLQQLLSTPPAPRTNTVLVSHGSNIMAATNLNFQEGDAAVLAPGGDAGFTLVARLSAADWTALAQMAPGRK